MPITKEAQIAEAAQRGNALEGHDANADLPADTTRPEAEDAVVTPGGAPHEDAVTPRALPQRRVDPRDAIAKRFQETRATGEDAAGADDIRAFTNEGMPPELLEAEAADRAAAEAGETGDAPVVPEEPAAPAAKRKLTVRGKDVELTDEELLAAAQRGLAGDSYFDEGRRIADEAKARLERVDLLLRQTEQGVRAPAGEHPASETAETRAPDDSEHPAENPFTELAKTLAYETPEVAGAKLQEVMENMINGSVPKVTKEQLDAERERDELARSRKTLHDVMGENPEIAQDPMAVAAIKTTIARMQLDDIRALGVDEAVLPKTEAEAGQWHLWYRANGMKVRPMDEILKQGVQSFKTWKGGGAETPPAGGKGSPRVVLSDERTRRRQSIQQQPTRTVTPRPDVSQSQQPRDRSTVVQAMAAARNKPRGKVAVTG